jgi:cytochrome c556
MHRRLTALVAMLAAVALATAACGGGGQLSHDQYQQKVNQIAASFKAQQQQAVGALGSIKSPADLAKVAPAMNSVADAIDQVADQLDGLNPPDDAADANQKLVEGFHGIADSFRELAKAAQQKDLAKLQQLGQELQSSPATKDLNQAKTELQKAGYKITT